MIPVNTIALLRNTVAIHDDRVSILDESTLRHTIIDKLIHQAMFGNQELRPAASWLIWEIAQELGIRPNSIHPLYTARGRGVIPANCTIPAMNFRGLTYDTCRALFKTAVSTNTKAFICELARGEMGYTAQTPSEYTCSVLAAAIREGFSGPIFIQGDHYQTKCSREPGVPDPGEIEAITTLIKNSLDAGFYNIDIDTSTLVDLAKPTVVDQQIPNIHYTSELLKVIRSIEPAGMTISVGGEIGHIGGKNSTVEDFTTFMDGLSSAFSDGTLISKISVATGTSHGGVVNPDGSLAKVSVDFNVLKEVTAVGRARYQLGGAVQHGASTLPDSMLHQFPPTGTLEIHLATGFQNLIFDHPSFPKELLQQMYHWLDETKQGERETGETDEQFHYKLRKKCWGQFKQATWELPDETRQIFRDALAERFALIFKELNVIGSAELVEENTPVHEIHKEPVDFALLEQKPKEVTGLSD